MPARRQALRHDGCRSPVSVAGVQVDGRVRVLTQHLDRIPEYGQPLVLLCGRQTLVEQAQRVRLQHENRLLLTDPLGRLAHPASVLVSGFETALGVLAAVAPGHVVQDEDRRGTIGLGLGQHGLQVAPHVAVPVTHPQRLRLLRDAIEQLGFLGLLFAQRVGAEHAERLGIDPQLHALERIALCARRLGRLAQRSFGSWGAARSRRRAGPSSRRFASRRSPPAAGAATRRRARGETVASVSEGRDGTDAWRLQSVTRRASWLYWNQFPNYLKRSQNTMHL